MPFSGRVLMAAIACALLCIPAGVATEAAFGAASGAGVAVLGGLFCGSLALFGLWAACAAITGRLGLDAPDRHEPARGTARLDAGRGCGDRGA